MLPLLLSVSPRSWYNNNQVDQTDFDAKQWSLPNCAPNNECQFLGDMPISAQQGPGILLQSRTAFKSNLQITQKVMKNCNNEWQIMAFPSCEGLGCPEQFPNQRGMQQFSIFSPWQVTKDRKNLWCNKGGKFRWEMMVRRKSR